MAKITRLALILAGIAAAPGLVAGESPPASQVIIRPEAAPGPLANPLKGWCPYTNAGPITLPYSMVYHYASWRELEPTAGNYDFDRWERRAWDTPGGRGKHVVFRVYVDYPGRPSGLPDWLKETVKLTPYKEYGGGLSPDYANSQLIEAMERLIAALGKRYDSDPRVAFVELGLLGHWGEWHTYPLDRLMASPAVEKRVIDAYHAAFPTVGLMARSARDDAGTRDWLGYHDDMFPADTDNGQDWSFLAGIRRSGRSENWKRAPIGGEMVPDAADKWLDEGFAQAMTMIERSHFSWVGPYCPALDKTVASNPKSHARAETMVRRLGYQYRWDELRFPSEIGVDQAVDVELRGINEGVAPFYRNWPVELALLAAGDGSVVARERIAVDIRTWLPGPILVQSQVKLAGPPGHYTLAVGIIDPGTKQPAIRFANKGEARDGWFVLGPVEVRRRAP